MCIIFQDDFENHKLNLTVGFDDWIVDDSNFNSMHTAHRSLRVDSGVKRWKLKVPSSYTWCWRLEPRGHNNTPCLCGWRPGTNQCVACVGPGHWQPSPLFRTYFKCHLFKLKLGKEQRHHGYRRQKQDNQTFLWWGQYNTQLLEIIFSGLLSVWVCFMLSILYRFLPFCSRY